MFELKLSNQAMHLVLQDKTLETKNGGLEKFVDSGFINVEVRYHNPYKRIMVIERPPAVYPLGCKVNGISNIPTPWQVYIVDYSSGIARIFFRKSQLTSLDDELFLCYLDHIKPDGAACTDGYHRINLREYLNDIEDPYKTCLKLINDSIWGGTSRGASYMHWYAGVPKEIANEPNKNRSKNVTVILDEKFTVERIMNEVRLLSYADDFKKEFGLRDHGYWANWFGQPMTLKHAISKSVTAAGSIKGFFEDHVQ